MSLLVVSDYGGATSEDWDYLRESLRAIAAQELEDRVEVILVDATPPGQPMPSDLLAIIPSVRVIGGPGTTRERMNAAVEATSAELIGMLDGDCTAAPGWLSAGVEVMRSHPEIAVVSGRTTYPNRGFTYRTLATLSRSFLDSGAPGPTRFVSSSNAIFRRKVLLDHPLEEFPRALAARLQSEAIGLEGGAFYFEPRMLATHRFKGWSMERRLRQRTGYRTIRVRQLNPRVPHAWMLRLGVLSIPLIVASRTVDSWRDCVRAGRFYGLRWFELPAAFAIAVAVHLLEIRGMLTAFDEERRSADAHTGSPPPTRQTLER